MRQLATIQKIKSINPIPDANKIEIIEMEDLGWQVIVNKGQYNVGDKVIYVEIDSLLPEKPEFEFLRDRKFKIKTMKLRGAISQGICFPMSILPNSDKYVVGDDVTEVLGITNYKDLEEEKDPVIPIKKNKLLDLLFRFTITRSIGKFILNLTRPKKSPWPSFLPHTDEERIQNDSNFFKRVSSYYCTEKLDGCSASFFFLKKRFGYKFGVCSRKIYLKTKHSCYWWNIADKYDIEAKLKKMNQDIYIQGEICGPSICQNKYQLTEHKFFIFNAYLLKEKRFMTYDEMAMLSIELKCGIVPWVHIDNSIPTHTQEWVEFSKGNSFLNKNILREGIVVRSNDTNIKHSIKIINPEFLLKYKE